MARFMVKASEFKNVCKAVNDRKLAELKKEIIEILKKQDAKEFKKAVDLFESQEKHYTHLEKSITGKWVEKAGYGIGTVRIWKGKKYKKIAPGKWARVFDKEGRGTNIAIGKLIAKVQKIDNIEDLMNFVMQNKQRFVDENGIDLPVLDKLRAAVDAKNNGGMGSKTTSKPAEKEDLHYSAKAEDHERNELVHKIKSYSKDIDTYEAKRAELERDGEKLARKDNLSKEEEKKLLQISKNRNTILQMIKERNAEVMEAKQKLAEYDERKRRTEEEKPAEKKTETKEVPFGGVDKTDKGEGIEALEMADKINEVARKGELKVGDAIFKVDKEGKEWAVRSEIMNAVKCKDAIDNINKNFDKAAKKKLEEELKKKLDRVKEKLPDVVKEGKLEEYKKIVDERLERYSEFGTTIDEVVEKYKKDLISKIENHVKDNQLFTRRNTDDIELLGDLEHQVELASYKESGAYYAECKKLLDEYGKEESEAEKHQNRSDAMKGNQNAKKYGLSDDQIEYYDIQEVVEDVNGRGIVRNSEGKYSYIENGSVKDRPEDFEEKIEKVRDRIDGSYQTQLNIEAAKAYDFKNADFGLL